MLTLVPNYGIIIWWSSLASSGFNKFGRRYAAARKPLQRFLDIVRKALWPHFPAVKGTFPTTDYAPETETLIFNIGGNKYRLIAHVDFAEQILVIQSVMTHEEYTRETF